MKSNINIEKLIQEIIKFRDDRDWEQFHNLKDLSIGLSIEAAELMELLLWKSPDEVEKFIDNKENFLKIEEELADILIFCLLIVHKLDIDVETIILSKLKKNANKYPINKAKGNSSKYKHFLD